MKYAIAPAALLALAAIPAGAEDYKVAHFTTANSSSAAFDQAFADKVTEKTGGDTTFEFFWSGSLGSGAEIVHLISGGAVKIGGTAPAYYPSELPIAGLTNSLPGVFPDAEAAMRAQRALTTSNPLYLAEAERVGVYPIVQHGLASSHMMCTESFSTVADLAGRKVRTFGYFLPVAVSALGMTPVSLATSEIYEGLERGVIDCVAVSFNTAQSYKVYEVAKYWSDINLGALSGPTLYAGYDIYFNEWDDAMRAIVDEASAAVFEDEIANLSALEAQAVAVAEADGARLIPFTEQDKVDGLLPDMLALWQEKQVADGMDAGTAAAVVDAVRAELAK